ncbi:restriction endonuclease [Oceaniradius stylonematis]|nr:restriction endonuclease [Oceaniradius stylonematis]
MITAIHDQTGTPQNPVDWSDPDTWIAERLSGEHARLATKVWIDSGKTVNPRHVYGCYLFINRLNLLGQSANRYVLGDRGERFLADDPALLQELDAGEGIPKILSLVAETPQAKRSDLIDDWGAYLLAVSKFSTQKVFGDTLRRRLLNLVERGLVERDGNRYSITDSGLSYLKSFPESAADRKPSSQRTDVALAVRAFNEAQIEALRRRLMGLEPYAFEHFVKELLEAMDYENVEVTRQSGDKGIDVVANYQFGITEITEVVQVKRTESTIGRRVIDELRGALPYHRAIRGTIITLGPFARGVEESALFPGAAPITLIDGDRLLELVVKHQIGVRRKPVDLLEVDEAFFADRSVVVEAEGADEN